jgi:hypothetical protein
MYRYHINFHCYLKYCNYTSALSNCLVSFSLCLEGGGFNLIYLFHIFKMISLYYYLTCITKHLRIHRSAHYAHCKDESVYTVQYPHAERVTRKLVIIKPNIRYLMSLLAIEPFSVNAAYHP